MLDIDEKIKEANTVLKLEGQGRVHIERIGGKLVLRALLPPKPNSKNKLPSSQRIFLGKDATETGLYYAIQKAKSLSSDLNLDKFKWEDWIEVKPVVKNNQVKYWIEKFEAQHWREHQKTEAAISTWRTCYHRAFSKLDSTAVLSIDSLLDAIYTTEPDSNNRRKVCIYLHKLAEFAGFSHEDKSKIKTLIGDYSPKKVNPRNLPSDEKIFKFWADIEDAGWRWVVGMLGAYGLRPHEILHLDISELPKLRVLEGKTGARLVMPYRREWVEDFKLKQKKMPPLQQSYENITDYKFTNKVSGWFYDRRLLGIKALDLRHCYARRCFEYKLDPTTSAKFMGHSLTIHIKTYSAWFGESVYLKAYNETIGVK